ncbi:hypothetical protein GP486_002118 [Trichoglossum hirsutum]|uniref:Uncharacterized protein n=1 Tax=Trichoglossum hirsutum TaxID=265104 RepID=A0A9P8LFJ2_9PEZI|nr:hypothetical protein GP486_002118 [Trichoglossum hirsutum]
MEMDSNIDQLWSAFIDLDGGTFETSPATAGEHIAFPWLREPEDIASDPQMPAVAIDDELFATGTLMEEALYFPLESSCLGEIAAEHLQVDVGQPIDAAFTSIERAPAKVTTEAVHGNGASQVAKRNARAQLKAWLDTHQSNPYPSPEEKKALAASTGLTTHQINTWFGNARGRYMRSPDPSTRRRIADHQSGLTTILPRQNAKNRRLAPTEIPGTAPYGPSQYPIDRYLSEDDAASIDAIRSASDTASSRQSLFSSASSFVSSNSDYSAGIQVPPSLQSDVMSLSGRSNVASSDAGSVHSYSCGSYATLGPRKGRRKFAGNAPYSPGPSAIRNQEAAANKTITFPCTVCLREFRDRTDWKRHEESVHEQQELWVCSPDGPREFSDGRLVCAFCRIDEPSEEHLLQVHNYLACHKRPVSDRIFYRREHLRQHLRGPHRVSNVTRNLDRWSRAVADEDAIWKCGFCGSTLQSWDERADHISRHFRSGETMASWDESIPKGKIDRSPTIRKSSHSVRIRATTTDAATEISQAAIRFESLLRSRIEGLPKARPSNDVTSMIRVELNKGVLSQEISRELERLRTTGVSSCPLSCLECHPHLAENHNEPLRGGASGGLYHYATSDHSLYEVLGLPHFACAADIRVAFQSALRPKGILDLLKKHSVKPCIAMANFILSDEPLKAAYNHLRAIRDQIISEASTFSVPHGVYFYEVVVDAIPVGLEKGQFLQLLSDLSVPTPTAIDYPFGIGLIGGPVYLKFEKAEHSIAAVSLLKSQNLRADHRTRNYGEEWKGGRLRNQCPRALSDLGLEPQSQGFEEIKTLGIDLSDPEALDCYRTLLHFREDTSRESVVFLPSLTSRYWHTIHELSRRMLLVCPLEEWMANRALPLEITRHQVLQAPHLQPTARIAPGAMTSRSAIPEHPVSVF